MRIITLLTILTLLILGCAVQPHGAQLSTISSVEPNTKIIVPTQNSISVHQTERVATVIAIKSASPTPLPLPTSGETEIFSTVVSIPTERITPSPSEIFYFGATPEMSQVGGINGVFYRESAPAETCSRTYSVFRFYDDGLVLDVTACDDDPTGDFPNNVWPNISKWFLRDNNDTPISRGIYHIVENKIWFTTITEYDSTTVVVDYFGTYSKELLVLDYFSHSNEHEATDEEFIRLNVSANP
jgi:hypothetical protein